MRRAISRQTLVSIQHELFLTTCTPRRFLALSTMADKSRRPKGQDGGLPSLETTIGALNRAKEATSITPAMAAFTSAGLLLTTIRVGSLPDHLFDCRLMYTGLDDQKSGPYRTGANLRQHLQSPQSGDRRKAGGPTQSACSRGNCEIGDVS